MRRMGLCANWRTRRLGQDYFANYTNPICCDNPWYNWILRLVGSDTSNTTDVAITLISIQSLFPNEPAFQQGFRTAWTIFIRRLFLLTLVVLVNVLLLTSVYLVTVPHQRVRDYVFAFIFVSPVLPLAAFSVQRYLFHSGKPHGIVFARRLSGVLTVFVVVVTVLMLVPDGAQRQSIPPSAYLDAEISPSPSEVARLGPVSKDRNPTRLGETPRDAFSADFFIRLNVERHSRNIPELRWDHTLADYATEWSAAMASKNTLQHHDFSAELDGWLWYGQTVGQSARSGPLHWAFMRSPKHRAILLRRTANAVGIGSVCHAGRIWVTINLVQYESSIQRPRTSASKNFAVGPYVEGGNDGLQCPTPAHRNAE
jgi:uncharacterized protein YkwD